MYTNLKININSKSLVRYIFLICLCSPGNNLNYFRFPLVSVQTCQQTEVSLWHPLKDYTLLHFILVVHFGQWGMPFSKKVPLKRSWSQRACLPWLLVICGEALYQMFKFPATPPQGTWSMTWCPLKWIDLSMQWFCIKITHNFQKTCASQSHWQCT